MIGKLHFSISSGNVVNYALNEEKNAAVLAAHGVRSWSAGEMAADFEAQQRSGVDRVLLHIALAWPNQEQEHLSNELMVELTQAYMREMGFDPANTQWALVRHFDQAHPHGHLLINTVDNDGNILDDSKNFQRSKEACRRLEQRYQLVDAVEVGLQQELKEVYAGERTGYEAARTHIHLALRRHEPAATSVAELSVALAQEGIILHGTYRQDKLHTVVFEREGEFVKGSAIDRRYGGQRLEERLEAQRLERQSRAASESQPAKPTQPGPAPLEPVSVAVPPVAAKPVALSPLPAPQPAAPQPTASSMPPLAEASPVPATPLPAATPPQPVAAADPAATQTALIFRLAATGERAAMHTARELVREHLTQALVTTATEVGPILQSVREHYDFNQDFTRIRHRESKAVFALDDVQPGGATALTFPEQALAVVEANQAAAREQVKQDTTATLSVFLAERLHFISTEELNTLLTPRGLGVTQAEGPAGGRVITHLASGQQFAATELLVNGRPLETQLQAAEQANWDNPIRRVAISCRDEQQAAEVGQLFRGLADCQLVAGQGRQLVVQYRLDSPAIEAVDDAFQAADLRPGARVLESAAANYQRADQVVTRQRAAAAGYDRER